MKSDRAVALIRDSLIGALSLHVFESHNELFDYSTTLARHVQALLGKQSDLLEQSTDLAHQVLMSTVPVLTPVGIKLKARHGSASQT